MWPFKFADQYTEIKIKDLEDEVDYLNELLKDKNEKELLKSCLFNDLDKSTFAIDFKAMNVVSIERMVTDDIILGKIAVTVLGYKAQRENGTEYLAEWTLRCSTHMHEVLVAEFKLATCGPVKNPKYEAVANSKKK